MISRRFFLAGITAVLATGGAALQALADVTVGDKIKSRTVVDHVKGRMTDVISQLLFEFNDQLTRKQFRDIMESYLADLKNRDSLAHYEVVCDETNNTQDVIDRNEFHADVYLQPTRAVPYMRLNVVLARTDVEFDDLVNGEEA